MVASLKFPGFVGWLNKQYAYLLVKHSSELIVEPKIKEVDI